jgi:hypothetical protein
MVIYLRGQPMAGNVFDKFDEPVNAFDTFDSPEYTKSDVASDAGREALKGAASTVDFLTGLPTVPQAPARVLKKATAASMGAEDIGLRERLLGTLIGATQVPQESFVPKIAEGKGFQDLTARNVEDYGEELEGLMTGMNFAGSAAVPFGKLKKARDLWNLGKGAVLFGGGAGGFDALTEDTSDIGKTVAGVTALASPYAARNIAKSGNLFNPTTKSDEAVTAINNMAKNPEELLVKAKAAAANRELGTLGQISGDPYILALEKGAKKDLAFSRRLDNVNEGIAEKSAKDIVEIAPKGADPQAFLQQSKERVGGLKKSIAKRADKKEVAITDDIAAREAELAKTLAAKEVGVDAAVAGKENVLAKAVAQQNAKSAKEINSLNINAINRANPSTTPINEIGTAGQKTLGANFTEEYGKAWANVKDIPAKAQQGVKSAAAKGLKTLAVDVEINTLKNLTAMMDDVVVNPTAAKVKAYDTALRNAANSAQASQPSLYNAIKDMRTGLRDGLDGNTAQRLKEIDSQYGKYLAVRKAGNKAKDNDGVFTAEQLNTSDAIVAGEKRSVEGEAFMQSLSKPMLGRNKMNTDTTKALQAAGDESIKQAKATGKAEATAAVKEAGKDVNAMQARVDALRNMQTSRANKADKTFVGKVADHDEAVNAVDKVFANTTNPISQTKALIKSAAKDPTGKATAGLKAAYIESLSRRITKSGDITADAADKFTKLRSTLAETFDPAELNRLDVAIKDSGKIKMHPKADLSGLPEAGKGALFYMASIFGIKAATAIVSGNSLLIGRLGREAAVDAAVGTPHKKMLAAMEDMLIDPAKYAEGIELLRKKPTQSNIYKVLAEWGVRAEAKGDFDLVDKATGYLNEE